MSTCVSKSFRLPSPLKVEEEAAMVSEKQGIVSILRPDSDQTKAAAASSLRRTLSADMSSKKWLAQNGIFPMKKIASSEHLPMLAADSSSSSSSEGEEEHEGKKELQKPGQHDIWSSILSQKTKEDASNLPPPYVHPLVKRSSSLSEKSLQVCTESLGSETGSDGFSSYPSSESGDGNEDKEEVQIIQQTTQAFDVEEPQLVKNTKKVVSRSFPPPLPSLKRGDGPSLHMHSHRQNGRLVLEAVSVPSTNLFHAERQDGRLLLTLLNGPSEEPNHEPIIDPVEDKIEEYPGEFDMFEVEKEEEDEDDDYDYDDEDEDENENEDEDEKEMSIVMVKEQNMASGVINLHRAALMKKLMGIQNSNPTWSHKFNKTAKLVEVEEKQLTVLPQSLPPPQRVARMIAAPPVSTAATSFNAYEYFWRAKPVVASLINPLTHQFPPLESKVSNNPKTREQQDLVHNLVPSLRGCKEPRRSLLIWEPFCIATS